MKLTNKIIALSLFCLSSLMAKDRKNINQVYGIDVALINIFGSPSRKTGPIYL